VGEAQAAGGQAPVTTDVTARRLRLASARYDADQMIATFSARLTGAVDLDGIRTDLLDVVRVLEPAHASAWVAGGDR
jgi:hypothetical protein